MFSLAAGISDTFDNAWYVAVPAYSLALLDGFGRMGHDAHWFSDVVGTGLLGWGTTELFQYLHRQRPSGAGPLADLSRRRARRDDPWRGDRHRARRVLQVVAIAKRS